MTAILMLAFLLVGLLLALVIKLARTNRELVRKIEKIDEENIWQRLALTDDLTGVYNRTAYSRHIMRPEERRKDIK